MKRVKEKVDFMKSKGNFMDMDPETEVTLLWKIIESSSIPITIIDHSDIEKSIIYCNEAFENMSGYDYTEIIGKDFRFLKGDDTDEEDLNLMEKALVNNEEATATIVSYTKDGKKFWSELTLCPVNIEGEVPYYFGMQKCVSNGNDAEPEEDGE